MIYKDVINDIKYFLSQGSAGLGREEWFISFFSDYAPEHAIKGRLRELKNTGVVKEKDGYYQLLSAPEYSDEELKRRSLVLRCVSQLHSKDVVSIRAYHYPMYYIVYTEEGCITFSLVRQTSDKDTIWPLVKDFGAGKSNIKHYAVVLEDKVGKEVLDVFDGYYLVSKEGAVLYEDQA